MVGNNPYEALKPTGFRDLLDQSPAKPLFRPLVLDGISAPKRRIDAINWINPVQFTTEEIKHYTAIKTPSEHNWWSNGR